MLAFASVLAFSSSPAPLPPPKQPPPSIFFSSCSNLARLLASAAVASGASHARSPHCEAVVKMWQMADGRWQMADKIMDVTMSGMRDNVFNMLNEATKIAT